MELENKLELLTIDDIKQQCRHDFNNQDPLAEAYGLHAEKIIQQILDKTFSELNDEWNGDIPISIRHACLLMADSLFGMDVSGIPLVFRYVPESIGIILKPYAKDGIEERIDTVNKQLKGVLTM